MKSTLCGLSMICLRSFGPGFPNFQTESLRPSSSRKRNHELGITLGTMKLWAFNAFTDMEGVRMGQTTIIQGEG
jgi:hypothetical protein